MVGNDTVTDAVAAVYRLPRMIGRGLNQVVNQISVVIIMLTLQQRADTFQPHAGINARLGQINARAVALLLKLHEHQIPNFDKAVAILIGTARRPTGNAFTMVKKDFRTRAAWTGIAH